MKLKPILLGMLICLFLTIININFVERDNHDDIYLFDYHIGYYYADDLEIEIVLTGKTK